MLVYSTEPVQCSLNALAAPSVSSNPSSGMPAVARHLVGPMAKDPGSNAMALSYALKSGYPTLHAAAVDIINHAFTDENENVTRAARRIGVSRNTMTKLLIEIGL